MDISKLSFEPVNFSGVSNMRWISRRIVIGFLLFLYYGYALIFVMEVITSPTLNSAGQGTDQVNEPIFGSGLADWLSDPVSIMMTFGFIGSVFFITRTFVRTGRNSDCSIAWYITRPLQGVLMALFIYYAFRAGEIVFYSGGGAGAGSDAGGGGETGNSINVYTLSILAIIAGMFTDHAYEWLQGVAENILKSGATTTENGGGGKSE